LVGKEGAYGPIPALIRPVFRDRADLSSASDLSAEIKKELRNSESLIVICSPSATSSHWVNREIQYFQELGREDRVFALIVKGDPSSKDASLCCFPEALIDLPDGSKREPLAADVRRNADGKNLSKLKIIAGVLGIRLDELRRRDANRRFRNRLLIAVASVIIVSVISLLINSLARTKATAEAQRANSEELLGFMLGDLQRLDPIEGLESVSPDDQNQSRLKAELGLDNMDNEALINRALAWRESGSELRWKGDLKPALVQFTNSRAALIELYQREGNTPRALFELGQSEYYVGEIYAQEGELDMARQHWSQYGALTRRLLNTDPKNPKYVMELSYTLMNLGALELTTPLPDVSKASELLQVAVQYNQMALVLDPENLEYQASLLNELGWLADAWMESCALGRALEVRLETVELARSVVEDNPADAHVQRQLAEELGGLAYVQQQIGLSYPAIASFQEAIQILRNLQLIEPDNLDMEWQALYREARMARLLMAMDYVEQANEILEPMKRRVQELGKSELNSDQFFSVEFTLLQIDYAILMVKLGETEEGKKQLAGAVRRFSQMAEEKPEFRSNIKGLAIATFIYWEQFGEKPAIDANRILGEYSPQNKSIESCNDAGLAARLAIYNGNIKEAKRYTQYVLGKGYFDPSFVKFCQQYELCSFK
jgi:tetratricopeptide (TPR) repeat protein